jgi:galactokinase
VNLIGDHTDYNEGYVLPIAIDRHVVAAAARRDDRLVRAWSLQQPDATTFAMGTIRPGAPGGWAAYVAGVAWALVEMGVAVGGFDLVLDGAVTAGAGLASSAAVECASTLALADLFEAGLERKTLALTAHRAEVEIVGVPCGVMDQMAAMSCREDHAMFLDTRTLATEHLPVTGAGVDVLVIDVRAPHRLVEGTYARRRAECEAAARELGLAALRDATASDVERLGDATLRRRARHVVTEDERVLEVASLLREHNLADIGPLLTQSHVSLRDDFDVSCAELDDGVEICLDAGALGARMTGGGFGGCAIALVPRNRLDHLRSRLAERALGRADGVPEVFVAAAAEGALRVA